MLSFQDVLLTPRCEAFEHTGELTWGDQVVWLRCERAAHRLYGQFLCWYKVLHVSKLVLLSSSHSSLYCIDLKFPVNYYPTKLQPVPLCKDKMVNGLAFPVYWPLKALYNTCHIHPVHPHSYTDGHAKRHLLIRSNLGFSILPEDT